jgi:hypothetical protein
MPKYRVQLSDGRIATVEGPQPPTEADVLAQLGPQQAPATAPPAAATAGMLPQSTPAGDPPAEDTRHAGIGSPNVRRLMQQMDDTGASLRKQAVENPARTGALIAATTAGGIVPAVMRGMAGAGTGLLLQRATDPNSEPLSVPETLKTMATEGGMQGAAQGAGALVTGLGKLAYKGGTALLPKTLKQQYRDISDTGFRENIALTRRGATKATGLVGQSRQQADDMLSAAEQAGAPAVQPSRVISALRPVRDKMQNQTALGLPDETPALADRARRFAKRNRGGIPLTKAQTLKREAQDLAESAYKARDKGATINDMDALTNESQARGLRQGIEEIVPAVGPINARTQSLMGVARGAEHAADTGHILSRLGGAGATGALFGAGAGLVPALAGAGIGSALTTPGGLTRLGLVLKQAGLKGPDAARVAALLTALGGEEPSAASDER